MGEGGAAALIEGTALHSGLRCRVRLHPGEGEVRFLVGGVSIPARVAYVTDTSRCTTLGKDGARLALVEHLLAALHIRGWWRGLTIEASAAELPILDGSAQGWLEAVTALGAPPPPPPALRVTRSYRWRFGDSSVTVGPGERRLCSEISFAHPAIGAQRWCGNDESFPALAMARTFGFLGELEALRARGLASAASLDNALVFTEEGSLSPLRFPDEPVRHKALDALGDLFLLGHPLHAEVIISRGSHKIHSRVMRDMLACEWRNGVRT